MAVALLGSGQGQQNPLPLNLAVAGKCPINVMTINEQSDPVALVEKGIGQRGCRLNGVLEEGAFRRIGVALLAGIKPGPG